MKYVYFDGRFATVPTSFNNMREAICFIGANDPLKIEYTIFYGHRIKKNNLTQKDCYNRGLLNIRRQLNRHLGKSGKFSNRMIRKVSNVIIRNFEASVNLHVCLLKATKDTISIVNAIFELLQIIDSGSTTRSLLAKERDALYDEKIEIINDVPCAIIPTQVNVVLRSSPILEEGKQVQVEIRQYVK